MCVSCGRATVVMVMMIVPLFCIAPPHGLDPVSVTTDFVPSHGFDIEFSPVWLLLQQPDGIGSTMDCAGSSTHYTCHGITCALLASLYIIRST